MKARRFHSATIALFMSWTGPGMVHAAEVTSIAAGDWSAAEVSSDAVVPSVANTFLNPIP